MSGSTPDIPHTPEAALTKTHDLKKLKVGARGPISPRQTSTLKLRAQLCLASSTTSRVRQVKFVRHMSAFLHTTFTKACRPQDVHAGSTVTLNEILGSTASTILDRRITPSGLACNWHVHGPINLCPCRDWIPCGAQRKCTDAWQRGARCRKLRLIFY